jgi:predicted alpha-1,2-mannosidase
VSAGTGRRPAKTPRSVFITGVRGFIAAAAGAIACSVVAAAPAMAALDPVRAVNVFSGTDTTLADVGTGGGAANAFPGAAAPFGMLQWSPDSVPAKVNAPGGYAYRDRRTRGFSLTHVEGVGCPIYQDVPILPTTTAVTRSPALPRSYDLDPAYLASYSHRDEQGQPGSYAVRLDPGTPRAIDVALTAGTRAGLGRFRFPATRRATLLFNTGGSATADFVSTARVDPARREVSGSSTSGRFCFQRGRYSVYFVARFDRPLRAYGTWRRQTVSPGATSVRDESPDATSLRGLPGVPGQAGNPSTTSQAGAYATFDTRRARAVRVQVAISFVSVADARRNLRAEAPGWSVPRARARARAPWGRALSRVHVRGGRHEDVRTFYTMLYHALLGPRTFSDASGRYIGMDGRAHRAQGFTKYADFSGWDVYRSQMQLLAVLFPRRMSDFVRSLLADARQSGWLPKWSYANVQNDVQVGDPADIAIASAYAFGARRFDARAALRAMVKGATRSGKSANAQYVERQGLAAYMRLGYVPQELNAGDALTGGATTVGDTDNVWGAAATTLEYTSADFAIARLAGALCDASTYRTFMRRSGNWRKLYNPATGYIEPRFADGRRLPGYDPTSGESFVEGNAAQYTWMVPYDLGALFRRMGGRAAAARRLDRFFTRINEGPFSPYAFLGNEPTLETPWEYDWLGRPYRTQAVVRRALLELYDPSPTGYPGNDDIGEMSSWWVFSALGLYPQIPGEDVLALGSPLFREATVRLGGGGVLRIEAPRASRGTPYVRKLTINGRATQRPWLRYRRIGRGARLRFDLARRPDRSWGSSPADAPPSYSPSSPTPCR